MSKIKGTVAAIALAAGTISALAFAKADKKEYKDPQPYHYVSQSTSPGAFANTSNWAQGPNPSGTCSGSSKPCELMANDDADLASQLGTKTNTQVLAITGLTKRD